MAVPCIWVTRAVGGAVLSIYLKQPPVVLKEALIFPMTLHEDEHIRMIEKYRFYQRNLKVEYNQHMKEILKYVFVAK